MCYPRSFSLEITHLVICLLISLEISSFLTLFIIVKVSLIFLGKPAPSAVNYNRLYLFAEIFQQFYLFFKFLNKN